MANILKKPVELINIEQQFGVFDEFTNDQSDIAWVDTVTDTGTVLIGDEVNGVATLTPSDGTVTDNDEVYLATPNEVFIFAADKAIYGIARVRFVETASGVFNAFVGFANAIGANTLVDDGGGMRASGCIAAIYKVDGETVWRCVSRNGSTVTVTQSTTTAGGSAYQILEIEVVPFTSTQLKVIFSVDGTVLKDSQGREIVHTIPVAAATEMQFGLGAKLGAITNNDVLKVDYAGAWQNRV
jgi:hypothetical protein